MATLRALIHDFIEEVEIEGKAAITAQRYRSYLDTFARWLVALSGKTVEQLGPSDLDAETLRRYRLFLARRRDPTSGKVIGASTRNLYQVALRNFLRYCKRRRFDVPDPDEHLELAKVRDVEVRHVTHEEAERIASAIDLALVHGLRDRAIVETLFGTGCRVSELVALRIRQVNLDRREAEVIGKGGKSRLILLTPTAALWLRRYVETREDRSPWLFVSNRHDDDGDLKAITVRQVQRIVDEAAKRAGIPFRVSPHRFRHGRLTILARHAGVEAAQRIAGHSSLSTTARYLHVSDDRLRASYDEAERKEGGA